MSSKKTIKVNTDFFKVNSSPKKDKSRVKKTSKQKSVTPNKMRKEFFKKIKDFQEKRKEQTNITTSAESNPVEINKEHDFENEFNKSLQFLDNIMKTRKQKKQSNWNQQILINIFQKIHTWILLLWILLLWILLLWILLLWILLLWILHR